MTEAMQSGAIPRSNSRFIRNPSADPRVEVQVSFTESRYTGEAPSVAVRCGPCDKRLYDVVVGQHFNGEYGMVEDRSLAVTRKCPHCGRLNEGRVTRSVGQPLETRDALGGPWRCSHCGRSLGKIDPIRGRVITTCRCGHESRQVAADAISVAYRAAS